MSDRIGCLNPHCRRTFKREHEDDTIVCGKCWKLLPEAWRSRYKQLRRRMKLINRMAQKGNEFRRRGRKHGSPDRGAPQAYTMGAKFDRLWDRHWERVRAFYLSPDKPAGLETFLEEIGL